MPYCNLFMMVKIDVSSFYFVHRQYFYFLDPSSSSLGDDCKSMPTDHEDGRYSLLRTSVQVFFMQVT